VKKFLFKLSVDFLLFIGKVFCSKKNTLTVVDQSWEAGQKRIYGRGMEFWQNEFLKFNVKKNGIDVLEVGSGDGQWLIAMDKLNFARKIEAVEPNDKFREQSLLKLKEYDADSRIKILDAYAEKLPYDSNSFDLVLCLGVFMFTDQNKSLNEFARVIKPGGTLVLNVSGIGYYLESLRNGIAYRNRSDIWFSLGIILRSIKKWIFKGVSKNTTVTSLEMRNKLESHGFSLKSHELLKKDFVRPKKHFGFAFVHLFIAEKIEND